MGGGRGGGGGRGFLTASEKDQLKSMRSDEQSALDRVNQYRRKVSALNPANLTETAKNRIISKGERLSSLTRLKSSGVASQLEIKHRNNLINTYAKKHNLTGKDLDNLRSKASIGNAPKSLQKQLTELHNEVWGR